MWPLLTSHYLFISHTHTHKQKASTHPPIHGALLGRWSSRVILQWWETPPIWVSMVPSLPSIHKTDWWAMPSHFGCIFRPKDSLRAFFYNVIYQSWMNNCFSFALRNHSRCLFPLKTTPCRAVKWTELTLLASTLAPTVLESPATHPLSLARTPLWVHFLIVPCFLCAFEQYM